ncbi:MAG: hypothetical protein JRI85_11165 [Deltaproteobacteria bacterium]|nr:hypothetical protein [Deltaproteobacteria bacterium]
MDINFEKNFNEFDRSFKIFHELMPHRVKEILLVSTLYDACIIEDDCRLSERIIHEYRGLNLSQPPRVTWVASAEQALKLLDKTSFDMVITMPRLADTDALSLGRKIKEKVPDLPVNLLTRSYLIPNSDDALKKQKYIDRIFVWSGNTDIMLAQIKSIEDRMNVNHDTKIAGVRVILFIEDSYIYMSSLLPVLYRQLVVQTQAVMEEGLNEEHRLLAMRARPKILVAENFEDASILYEQFKPYLLGVISDVRYPRKGVIDEYAGIKFLSKIKDEIPDLPLLLTSSESINREHAVKLSASFIDKNSPSLHADMNRFFIERLGFSDFVFRGGDDKEVARASNLRELERILPTIPIESYVYHASRNDFSRWLFSRSEILLASMLRPSTVDDFEGDPEKMRDTLCTILRSRRKWRQKGVVVNFDVNEFDPDTDFLKIGKGSMGGKARGLVFLLTLLNSNPSFRKKFADVNIVVPKILVLTTEVFDTFIEANNLKNLSMTDDSDEKISVLFERSKFPKPIEEDLKTYLSQTNYPLAIRSSGLLEDSEFRAYAGLYRTYILPNDHLDLNKRLGHLIKAIKLVYASTYFQGPKAFAKRLGHRTEEEKMAVIIQQLVGEKYGNSFYPAISGVAQSLNYYPVRPMKLEDGVATIALGLGKTIAEGGKALRFCPKYPHLMPYQSTIQDILENSQRSFYALRMAQNRLRLSINEDSTLERRVLVDAAREMPVKMLTSSYIPEEHRIRDTVSVPENMVLTFINILKYSSFPLSEILNKTMILIRNGMGCPVEIEFSVNLRLRGDEEPEFALLQIRPMSSKEVFVDVEISDEEISNAFCFSQKTLGNSGKEDFTDIIYVKPDAFSVDHTPDIAKQIGVLNKKMVHSGRKYILIGPGRWGSADRWLGIPVSWADISGVGAIIETSVSELKAEPSQGSHFFHNITTIGINYITVSHPDKDFIDWEWLTSLNVSEESYYIAHAICKKPITLKVDGKRSVSVILAPE